MPTDEAFGILPSTLTSELMADKERLKEVLLNHVVSEQKVLSTDFVERENVATAAGGKTIRVNIYQLAPTTPVSPRAFLSSSALICTFLLHGCLLTFFTIMSC